MYTCPHIATYSLLGLSSIVNMIAMIGYLRHSPLYKKFQDSILRSLHPMRGVVLNLSQRLLDFYEKINYIPAIYLKEEDA